MLSIRKMKPVIILYYISWAHLVAYCKLLSRQQKPYKAESNLPEDHRIKQLNFYIQSCKMSAD